MYPASGWLFALGSLLAVWSDVLSAGEEAALLGHLVAVLALFGNGPGHADDADEDEADDGRVALPVGGLRIPTTGRRPDVLGVPAGGQRSAVSGRAGEALAGGAHGIFPPPPIVKCRCGDIWGWV